MKTNTPATDMNRAAEKTLVNMKNMVATQLHMNNIPVILRRMPMVFEGTLREQLYNQILESVPAIGEA